MNSQANTAAPKFTPFLRDNWSTCRVCGEAAPDLVKYSTRHYAHAECAMEKWGAAFFDRLTPWQASRFPYFAAEKFGAEKALIARAELTK